MSTKRPAAKRPTASLGVVKKRPKQVEVLHGDVLARILSYLPWNKVMNCRVVSREWRDAALITPVQEMVVDEEDIALALPSLAAALPCLQSLEFVRGKLPYEIAYLNVNDQIFRLTRGFHQLTSLVMINATLEFSTKFSSFTTSRCLISVGTQILCDVLRIYRLYQN
jgi:hypothetical protein